MRYVRNCWYVAAWDSDLPAAAPLAVSILDEAIVLWRDGSGEVVALEDRCVHRHAPLSLGRCESGALRCMYHGLLFDAAGVVIEIPGQPTIPPQARVRRYPVVVRHSWIWVWLGDAAAADVHLIPPAVGYDDGRFILGHGQLDYTAPARLINDNLLDLSHESYVHTRTIGNEEEESIANFPLEVTVEGDRLVRAHREMPNIDPPPFFAMILDHKGRIDRWQTAINLAPGINMTDVGVYPVGTPRKDAFVGHVLHLLTPETDHSTHYFWSMTRNYRLDNAPLTQAIRDAVNLTFDEDRKVLEVQQAQIARLGGAIPRVALRLDEAPLRARRLLAALVEREQADPDYVMEPLPLIDDRYLQG